MGGVFLLVVLLLILSSILLTPVFNKEDKVGAVKDNNLDLEVGVFFNGLFGDFKTKEEVEVVEAEAFGDLDDFGDLDIVFLVVLVNPLLGVTLLVLVGVFTLVLVPPGVTAVGLGEERTVVDLRDPLLEVF